MKKRLKGLLALTLALCMVLGMTTGIASATAKFELADPGVIKAGDSVSSSESGGVKVVYIKGEEEKSVEAGQYNKVTIANCESLFTEEALLGYVKTSWQLASEDYDGTKWQDIVVLKLKPIDYTIIYDPGVGTGTPAKVGSFTVENMINDNIANPVDLGFKRDGYTPELKWELGDGSTVNVDVPIKDIFYSKLIDKAVVDTEDPTQATIILTAVWKAASGGVGEPPEAEKPYTLKYKPNKSKTGLKGSIPSQKFYKSADNTTSVDENMYIKPIDSFDNADQPGYSFTWNTKANGKGKTIKEWADIEDVEDTLIKAADKNNVITLYAQRTMNTYKINYFDGDPDDPDTEPIDEQKITAEDIDEERLPDADDDRIKDAKPGYILKEWKYVDRETGEEIIFEPGQKIDKDMFADIAAFEGMELYAVWEKLDGASRTGDSSNILPWLILATAAALGAVAMTTRKRTEK